jgi:hypothetical protein
LDRDEEIAMTRYRNALPQLRGDLFLSDGGIETTLISRRARALPPHRMMQTAT